MSEPKYKFNYGVVELQYERRFEGGRMVSYSYAIHRDNNGIETHRTEPTDNGSIGYDDGTPFTAEDYVRFSAV